MSQRHTDPEGFRPPSRINWGNIITILIVFFGIAATWGKAEVAMNQAEKVPDIEKNIAVIQNDMAYLKEAQKIQIHTNGEMQKDMKAIDDKIDKVLYKLNGFSK